MILPIWFIRRHKKKGNGSSLYIYTCMYVCIFFWHIWQLRRFHWYVIENNPLSRLGCKIDIGFMIYLFMTHVESFPFSSGSLILFYCNNLFHFTLCSLFWSRPVITILDQCDALWPKIIESESRRDESWENNQGNVGDEIKIERNAKHKNAKIRKLTR